MKYIVITMLVVLFLAGCGVIFRTIQLYLNWEKSERTRAENYVRQSRERQKKEEPKP